MFSTAQPMPGFGRLFALICASGIGVVAIAFTGGVMVERHLWENSDMGKLCAMGDYPWACHLHPDCTMHSMHCLPSLTEDQLMRIEHRLKEPDQ